MKTACENKGRHLWTPPPPMTTHEFNTIGEFIQSTFGIKMPPAKKAMLQSRLMKRLRARNISNYQQYQEYLFSPTGMKQEVPLLIDAVTTNKTDFFREQSHFDLLSQELLPAWMEIAGGKRPFIAWSAGCATGEEPYSLGITLCEFAQDQPSFSFTIIGTDISQDVLQKARQAVYSQKKIQDIPAPLKKKYFMKSRDPQKQLVRIVPELRNQISFRVLNLMDDFPCPGNKKDAIFCRNVIIYFERPAQENLFRKCCRCLRQGGYLFIGHSETLNGMHLPLKQIRPTVYQKKI